ncbi:hypothetical protein CQA53_01225 [Helicobacter didelphidarum]|uniref:Uncharacterized protein n=1 Tax=Helicobacter didelphidarum TaxID=2040648 RepID=A0A3D8IR23_9HELI|nr:hypothetical protein [Helicobacter didelphidarum]RDU67652.1 hypothetical protein CQA53_01225 [Helicobacter didelphidarum]
MALLKDVEPDIIFRHFILSILFVGSVAYYINTFIMPNIDSYKEQVRFTRTTQSVLETTRAINADAQSKINSFSNANYKELKVFSGKINEATIRKSLPKGFLKINVKRLNEEFIPNEQLKKTHYTISGEVGANNLGLILNIVPKLHENNISAILNLPFTLKKTAKNNLEFSLGVSITQSTYTRK